MWIGKAVVAHTVVLGIVTRVLDNVVVEFDLLRQNFAELLKLKGLAFILNGMSVETRARHTI